MEATLRQLQSAGVFRRVTAVVVAATATLAILAPQAMATYSQREAAVAALRDLHNAPGSEPLWEYTDDEAYSVRWKAAAALAAGGSGAYLALRDRIGRVLANASSHSKRHEEPGAHV